MNKVALLVASLFWLVATGLYLTSMLTHFWVSSSFAESTIANYGLFKFCRLDVCLDFGWRFTGTFAVLQVLIPRIIMLAAAGFVVIGLKFGFAGFFAKNSCLLITEGIFLIIAGFVIFGACATFTALNLITITSANNDQVTVSILIFHYSYYFAWISGLLYMIAGVGIIIGGRSKY